MVRLIVRHDVNDYAEWRAHFDEFHSSGVPAERGVRAHTVYHEDGNPNNVTVMLDFDDAETAQAYVMNPDNQQILAESGVKGDGLLMSVVQVDPGS